MKVCRWCGCRIHLWRRYCTRCRRALSNAYLHGESSPCKYMAHLPKAGEQ